MTYPELLQRLVGARRFGMKLGLERMRELLDRLGHASSKAEEGPRESPSRPGWSEIPSAAPADQPHPRSS